MVEGTCTLVSTVILSFTSRVYYRHRQLTQLGGVREGQTHEEVTGAGAGSMGKVAAMQPQ